LPPGGIIALEPGQKGIQFEVLPEGRYFRDPYTWGWRIAKITGRSDDMLIIRGVNVFPSQIEELILKQPKLSPHYLIEVWRDGHLDSVAVDVELKREYRYLSPVDKEYVANALQRHIKSFVGITTEVRIVDIGGIERSLGKARRVIDKRPRE